ncbi:MAG: hypothetical protein EB101_11325 [Chitinophagia bacterium]|nr:hypothetical protein [Chitinophagia bacterium]
MQMALLTKIKRILKHGNTPRSALQCLWEKDYEKCVQLAEQALSKAIAAGKRLDWRGDIWNSGDLLYGYLASKELGSARTDFLNSSVIPEPLESRKHLLQFTTNWLQEWSLTSVRNLLSQPECPTILIAACAGIGLDVENMIETGTFLGSSSLMVSPAFKRVYTVEANPLIAECAQDLHNFAKVENISITTGDSAQYLENLSSDLLGSSAVYLDAHFSGGPTSRAYGETPLAKELAIVMNKAPVICIDDIRYCGKKGYPSLHEILSSVGSAYQATVLYDQLVLTKRSNPLGNLWPNGV